MLRILTARLLRVLLVASLFVQPSFASPTYNYKVESGDLLTVDIVLRGSLNDLSKISVGLPLDIVGESVYSHHTVTVTPDGFLFLPGLSPLQVKGMNLEEIEQTIATNLNLPTGKRFVSVALVRTNSMAFYVWGEVRQPGRFLIDHPTFLVEALASAGGPTEHARMKKVLLLRAGQPSLEINLSAKQLKAEGVPAIEIHPADTIIVPRSWTLDQFIVLLLLSAISTATGAYVAAKTH